MVYGLGDGHVVGDFNAIGSQKLLPLVLEARFGTFESLNAQRNFRASESKQIRPADGRRGRLVANRVRRINNASPRARR